MFFTLLPMTILSLIFPFINHPLAMTLTIVLQTLIICLTISNMAQTFWFSYILFLVFLGGMLVLFIYITSLAANEVFPMLFKPMLTFLLILTSLFILSLLTDSSIFNFLSFNMENQELSSTSLLYNEPIYLTTKLYNMPTNFLTLMLVMYLLLTLIVVVKITNIFLGPLRQKS